MSLKFQISGTIELDITVDVEAESLQDAIDELECASFSIEESMSCSNLSVSRFEEDGESKNLSYEKWDENMSRVDRMQFLMQECGVSEDDAYELADKDACDISDEYFENLEV
jgi:hypothetical protein